VKERRTTLMIAGIMRMKHGRTNHWLLPCGVQIASVFRLRALHRPITANARTQHTKGKDEKKTYDARCDTVHSSKPVPGRNSDDDLNDERDERKNARYEREKDRDDSGFLEGEEARRLGTKVRRREEEGEDAGNGSDSGCGQRSVSREEGEGGKRMRTHQQHGASRRSLRCYR
jgi:hypothetical protein